METAKQISENNQTVHEAPSSKPTGQPKVKVALDRRNTESKFGITGGAGGGRVINTFLAPLPPYPSIHLPPTNQIPERTKQEANQND